MAAELSKLNIKVTFAWWLKWWIHGVVTVAVLTGREPDWEKVGRMIKRGMRMKVGLSDAPAR